MVVLNRAMISLRNFCELPTDDYKACCNCVQLCRLLFSCCVNKVSNAVHRCGSRIEEPNGASVNASPQSPFQYGQSPWHPFTIAITRPQLGLVLPTAVWTRRGMGRGRYSITCPYRAMGQLCTCTIHYHQTGIRQGHHLQNLLRTAPKWVPWQRQVLEWEGHPLRIQTSPSRSTVLPSNFRLAPTLHSNAEITLPMTVAMAHQDLWRHKITVKNASLRYSVLSGIPQALRRWEWRPRNMLW